MSETQMEESVCDRFQEYNDRNYGVFFVPQTANEKEEEIAFSILFTILRKQTAIMIMAPEDPQRYEPAYRNMLKFKLPIIRHSRLYTSKVPKNNRVYFIEESSITNEFYACGNLVIPGATLDIEASRTVDLETPIRQGKAILVGPNQKNSLVQEAIHEGVIASADSVESLGLMALDLLSNPAKTEILAKNAYEWWKAKDSRK